MSVAEPEVAVVLSPEAWVERFHRHCTDHGGARVRQVVMDPALALEDEDSTLVVSHRWPALSPALVDALHRRGRSVLGVYDPTEPAAREHLASVGVDEVIAADAEMNAFIHAVASLAPIDDVRRAQPDREHVDGRAPSGRSLFTAVGGPAGSGATEIAIALTDAMATAGRRSVIVDADDVTPSVAPRLALPIEPNLRSAVDAVEFGLGDLRRSIVRAPDAGFGVLSGLPNVAAWSQVRPAEVVAVIKALSAAVDDVIVNVGHRLEDIGGARGRYGISRAVLAEAGVLVAVSAATPIGVSRLLAWIADARMLLPEVPVVVVVNQAPRDGYRRAELADEVVRSFEPSGLFFVADDRRAGAVEWEGSTVGRGPFRRDVRQLAQQLAALSARRGPVGSVHS
jgi:MinD-like ATPase involved in chromosome partitioning or flagellar assembly